MTEEKPNWSVFYTELGKMGPVMLRGIPKRFDGYVQMQSQESDDYWSEWLSGTLERDWADNPEKAVWDTIKVWLENVRGHLREILGPWSLVPWDEWGVSETERTQIDTELDELRLERDDDIVKGLVAAAAYGLRFDDSPTIILQAAVQLEESVPEGRIIKAVEIPWKMIVDKLQKDWGIAFLIPPHKWEELIATAFDRAGYDEVILTPRSGDHGRDVIAVKKGIGAIRVIGSVKAYKPGNLVRHDDVRALMGVLQSDRQASKGIVTTTSDFAPGIKTDPLIAPLIPYRLELLNGTALRQWLTSL